jgi:pyruvyltransferase
MRAWWYGGKNWGDILTPILIERLTGEPPVRALGPGTVLAIGSILHRLRARDVVWGTGAVSPAHFPHPIPPGVVFRAVRGPHVRAALMDAGAKIPEVYGDPGLLVRHLYRPEVPVRYKLGIIPHYIDKAALAHLAADPETLVVDIEAGVEEVIRAVASCEKVVSSSLHGIIAGEALGKPTAWLRVDGCQRLVGATWKFGDYYASTGRLPLSAEMVSGGPLPLLRWLPPPEIDLERLLAACPFNPRGLKLADIPCKVLTESAR